MWLPTQISELPSNSHILFNEVADMKFFVSVWERLTKAHVQIIRYLEFIILMVCKPISWRVSTTMHCSELHIPYSSRILFCSRVIEKAMSVKYLIYVLKHVGNTIKRLEIVWPHCSICQKNKLSECKASPLYSLYKG